MDSSEALVDSPIEVTKLPAETQELSILYSAVVPKQKQPKSKISRAGTIAFYGVTLLILGSIFLSFGSAKAPHVSSDVLSSILGDHGESSPVNELEKNP